MARIPRKERIRLPIHFSKIPKLPFQQLQTNGQAAKSPKPRPKRRPAPVAIRKESREQIALERRRQKAVFRIVEGDEGVVGLVPQTGIAIGVK